MSKRSIEREPHYVITSLIRFGSVKWKEAALCTVSDTDIINPYPQKANKQSGNIRLRLRLRLCLHPRRTGLGRLSERRFAKHHEAPDRTALCRVPNERLSLEWGPDCRLVKRGIRMALKIGALARSTGVKIDTVRYYERCLLYTSPSPR